MEIISLFTEHPAISPNKKNLHALEIHMHNIKYWIFPVQNSTLTLPTSRATGTIDDCPLDSGSTSLHFWHSNRTNL